MHVCDNCLPILPLDVVTQLWLIASAAAQAGTLIHEASHVLADTGDYIKGRPGRVLPGSDPAMSNKVGCKPLFNIPCIVLIIKFRHKADRSVHDH